MSDSAKSRVTSGSKFRNEHGFSAIKDGIKRSGSGIIDTKTQRKPSWLRARMPGGERYEAVRKNVSEHRLSTVCQESHCPNIGECWANGTATIMVMGSVCTRACRFCAVDTGNPKGWLDHEEPENTAKSVELMGLRYIVLTSVDRDDLDDGGAAHYAACVSAIKQRTPHVAVEALTPDFDAVMAHRTERGNREAPDYPCSGPSRRLRENPQRTGARQTVPSGRAHQDQPDAGPR
jgi:lipoic acid synthetase